MDVFLPSYNPSFLIVVYYMMNFVLWEGEEA